MIGRNPHERQKALPSAGKIALNQERSKTKVIFGREVTNKMSAMFPLKTQKALLETRQAGLLYRICLK
jgi:hypothetical protein